MREFWDGELTEEEIVDLLAKANAEIRRRGMVVPAIICLEMHKPLAFVAANATVAMAPFLVPLFGFEFVNNYSRLLSNKENVERLITLLEVRPVSVVASAEESCPTP